jgi:hypothetical protein
MLDCSMAQWHQQLEGWMVVKAALIGTLLLILSLLILSPFPPLLFLFSFLFLSLFPSLPSFFPLFF